jgi:hypothetical protein
MLTTVSCGASTSAGVITGGIIPCEGLPVPNGPHYAAGVVTVFKGHVTLQDNSFVFPREVVAHQTVQVNATYRFELPAGHYVLQARFPPPANVVPFKEVTLSAGETQYVDIPNVCK